LFVSTLFIKSFPTFADRLNINFIKMKQTILNIIVIFIMALTVFAEGKDGNMKEKAINKQNMNTSVKPGDNFYEYVNGGWIKTHPIPPEYSQYGAFTILYEDNQEKLRSLIKKVSAEENAPEGSVAQKIRDFYNSGMDTGTIEKLGIKPVQKQLEEINNLKSKEDVASYIATMQRKGMTPLFYFFAEADQRNSTMEIANLYQGGLGLPDVDYYLNEDEASAKLRDEYVDHLTKMFVLKGDKQEQAEKSAKAVMNLETKLAKTSFTRIEQRDPVKNYNKMSLAGLIETAPDFNWSLFFKTLGLEDPGDINVGQVKFFKGVSDLMNETDMETWKAYLTWNLLDASANYLSDDFVKQNFEFYGKTLSGQQEMQPRWKRVLEVVSNGLGEALGQLYVEEYFPASSKERMVTLVNNLRAAFGDRIKQLDWMTGETKEKALEKLASITVKIGYPDKWRDYSKLEIIPGNYFSNVIAAREFSFNRNLNKIGKPVDKTEWGMTPQTVNAYYNPSNNEIVFPAAILQPPFFNPDADDAVNYGAIGVVIGHEMTHGFDDQGRQYDNDGNLNDWWTEEDAKRFKAKTDKLVALYDNYVVLDSLHVNGSLTLGENIADLGGLNISYEAYQKSLNGETPKKIDGFTAVQRFYMGYAQVWRQNIRPKEMARRLKTDVHSPGEARVNIPPFNIDSFIKAFDVKKGDRLFINEDERAYIW
jgi:putative endopeptidase